MNGTTIRNYELLLDIFDHEEEFQAQITIRATIETDDLSGEEVRRVFYPPVFRDHPEFDNFEPLSKMLDEDIERQRAHDKSCAEERTFTERHENFEL